MSLSSSSSLIPRPPKRPFQPNFDESSMLVKEISRLNNVLNDTVSSLVKLPDLVVEPLASSINKLSTVLSTKLDKIILLLENRSSVPSTTLDVNNAAATSYFNVDKTVEQLCNLKNLRKESVYKIAYNDNHAEIYRLGLLEEPKKVPHKLHERIHKSDPDTLKEIKIKKTIHNVNSEIEELLYHKSIHENKVCAIDRKAVFLIDAIPSEEIRNKTREKWNLLIRYGEENVQKAWLKKREFLQSDKHLIVVGTCATTNKPAFKQYENRNSAQRIQNNNIPRSNITKNTIVFENKKYNDNDTLQNNARRDCETTQSNACRQNKHSNNLSYSEVTRNNYEAINHDDNNSPWTLVSHRQKNFRSQPSHSRLKQFH